MTLKITKKDIDSIQDIAFRLVQNTTKEIVPNLILLAAFERWLLAKGIKTDFEVEYQDKQEFYDSLGDDYGSEN